MQFKHQGDVPFYPFTGPVAGTKQPATKSLTIALGEHTGHKHVLTVDNPADMEAWKQLDGGWIITLKADATLSHNQHGPLTIEPGTYRVGAEREIDWFADGIARQVID